MPPECRHSHARVMFCGPSGCGKDFAGLYVASRTGLQFGTLSRFITEEVARRRGIAFEEASAIRHSERETWVRVGDELRRDYAAELVRRGVEAGDGVFGGVRRRTELDRAVADGLVDLAVWIDADVPPDPTLDFGPDACSVRVANSKIPGDFERRLESLFRCLVGISWTAEST